MIGEDGGGIIEMHACLCLLSMSAKSSRRTKGSMTDLNPFFDLKNMSGSFSGYNSRDLINDLLDVSGVAKGGGAQLGELDAEARVSGDVDIWWERRDWRHGEA